MENVSDGRQDYSGQGYRSQSRDRQLQCESDPTKQSDRSGDVAAYAYELPEKDSGGEKGKEESGAGA